MCAGAAVLQGNGHERDFVDDRRVFIMDMYNRNIYPGDRYAKSEWKFPQFPFKQNKNLYRVCRKH